MRWPLTELHITLMFSYFKNFALLPECCANSKLNSSNVVQYFRYFSSRSSSHFKMTCQTIPIHRSAWKNLARKCSVTTNGRQNNMGLLSNRQSGFHDRNCSHPKNWPSFMYFLFCTSFLFFSFLFSHFNTYFDPSFY